jgi:predicted DNA-binding transcriptional regulator AlpA
VVQAASATEDLALSSPRRGERHHSAGSDRPDKRRTHAALGSDVQTLANKTGVSLRRRRQFAVIEVPSAARIRLGLILADEIAAKLRMPKSTVRYKRHRGELPFTLKLGRRVVAYESEVDVYIAAQRMSDGGDPAA